MRTLTLKRGGLTSWDDGSPFSLPDDLEVMLDDTADNGEYVIAVELNGKKAQYKTHGSFIIPYDFLAPGTLEMTVVWRYKGVDMAKYRVEPLIICEEAETLEAMPVITALNAEIAALRDELTSLKETLDEHKQRAQTEIQELASGLTTVKSELTRRMDLIEGGYDPLQV